MPQPYSPTESLFQYEICAEKVVYVELAMGLKK